MRKIVCLVVLLVGCAMPARYEEEMQAYAGLLREQIQAGKITEAQARYLFTLKSNELHQRRSAEIDAALAGAVAGQQIMNQSGPRTLPSNMTTCVEQVKGMVVCQ